MKSLIFYLACSLSVLLAPAVAQEAETVNWDVFASGTPSEIEVEIKKLPKRTGLETRKFREEGASSFLAHYTPLMWAAEYNPNPESIYVLTKAGAELEPIEIDRNSTTPLMLAARNNNSKVVAVLIEAGADLEAKDQGPDFGQTPLIHAVRRYPSDPEVVFTLLMAGASAIEAEDNGENKLRDQSPLHYAVVDASLEVVELLIEAGADIEFALPGTNTSPRTPLMDVAVMGGSPGRQAGAVAAAIISLLLEEGAELEQRNEVGHYVAGWYADYTPLMWSVINIWDNLEIVLTFIEAGANLEAKDINGVTALMLAAGYNDNPKVILALLEAGADLKTKDKNDVTALMRAAGQTNNPGVLLALIKAGADLEAIDKGVSPLNLWRRANGLRPNSRHPYAEHYMDRFEYGRVNSKSNPESIMEDKNRRGVTALMRAAESNPNPTIALVLIDAGAEIEAADKDGVTSLMRAAASNSNPEVVLALIDRGADLEAKDKKGMTPLMHAAANNGVRTFSRMIFRAKTQKLSAGLISRLKESESEYAKDSNSKVALALIDKGANLEAKDKKGMTPLMHAAASNTNPDVISALIEAGADAKAKNKSGKNALYYAKKNDYINKSEAYQDLKNAIKKKR